MRQQIYLIRHGRQDSTLCNVNVPLAKEGRRQAQRLAERMSCYPIYDLYSSELIRAKETAEILMQSWNTRDEAVYPRIELKVRPNIQEIDFGELTGCSEEEIRERFQSFMRERELMNCDLAFPNGENGEAVWKRAYPEFLEILRESGQSVVIVTHGGVIRTLLAGILGVPQKDKLRFSKNLENCSITELSCDYDTKTAFTIERVNDAAHLEAEPELMRTNWKR